MTVGAVLVVLCVLAGVLVAAEGVHILLRGWSLTGYLVERGRAPMQRLVGVAALVLAVALVLFPWGGVREAPVSRVISLALLLVANGLTGLAMAQRRRAARPAPGPAA